MASWIIPAIFIVGVLGVILLGTLIIIAKFYR